MKKFYVIGLDDNKQYPFDEEVTAIIAEHAVFSGGRRHYELVWSRLPEGHVWIDIAVPLDAVFERYNDCAEVVVFASGDPLFFGFANTIKKRLPEAEIVVFPYFNSLQTLAHRLVMPYHDMHVASLTGRPWHEFDRALIEGKKKIGVLTDHRHTPSVIAARMLTYGYDNYRMSVGEILGNPAECVRVFALPEAVNVEFAFPNCLILEQTRAYPRMFGIPESEFQLLDGRARMITKMPVRLLTLSMLDLHNCQSFWDVGFCTGSVSVEAKLQFPHLQIVAFEIREEGRDLMDANSRKFRTPGIHSVIGDFTEADLSGYAVPDAVFIGGHGGKMEKILSVLSGKMHPGTSVVFNSVSEESLSLFQQCALSYNFRLVKTVRMAVDDFNPITIVKAVKQ